ncbi:hypothetical protein EVAR_99475_1 [Eumeta japonica]|uniref:Uncharacterized protein n=1 Tax=Eumeta variegata TaxID=151549 RepID=A0A4C1ZTK8_EUMVA|nr:hypothetical protein EVAR_99475_1 [Eumeta japonica]
MNSLNKLKGRTVGKNQFSPLSSSNHKTVWMDNNTPSSAGGKDCRPAPPRVENSWSKPLPWVKPRHGEAISTIMSILQVVRSSEVADLVAKFRKARSRQDAISLSRLKNL